MKKPLIILALAAGLLAACGGEAVVATVGDTEILESDVASLLQDASVIPAEQFADELLDAIVEVVVIGAASADFGVTVSSEQVDHQVDDVHQQ